MSGHEKETIDIFTQPIERRMYHLHTAVRDLSTQVAELHELLLETRRMIPTEETLRGIAAAAVRGEGGKLERLRDDVIRLMEFNIEHGVYSREDVNAAVAPPAPMERD